jgi:5-hydroxyisourate hydrolase
MSHLTTHVLDAARGVPAQNVAVILTRIREERADEIAAGETDADGRLALGPDRLEPGTYQLAFATGAYFAAHGTETFYPLASITFTVADDAHYHVPLLLSPFAYSTYRGS